MKPSRTSLFFRVLAPFPLAVALAASASADPINWIGASGGTWNTATNWNPASVPGASDVATFSITANAVNLNLDSDIAVGGLETLAGVGTNVHNLIGDGTDRTLTLGASGINHFSGGLTIGSGTAGQRVNVVLADSQTWNSARASGSGSAQAIFVNNAVTLAGGLGEKTLELTGNNTGSYISGVIGNEAGSTLNIRKTGTGVWTLNGANTYGGTTLVEAGTLRLGAVGVAPSSITVNSGATLGFRIHNGTSGMTSSEIDTYVAGAGLAADSLVAIDTSSGSGTYSGDYTASYKLLKTGGNYLTLTGTNAPGNGTSVNEGGLILTNATSLAGAVSVAANAALIVSAGGAGFTEAEIAALRSSPSLNIAGTGYFGISTANGDFSYGLVLDSGGAFRFTKVGSNTLFLTGQNTYGYGTQIAGGILSVSEIKDGGVASQMGASPNVANGVILAGGRLQYTGGGHTTDRLFNLTATSTIEASGTGALVFGGTGTMSAENGSRTLYLTGYSGADNRMNVNLANVTGGSNTTSVTKNGSGKWILSGNNTHTGATRVRGGTLVLDYSGGKTPVSATGQLVIQNGTLEFLGSGEKTVSSIILAENENGFGVLKVTGGMALTATTLASSSNSQRHLLIDLSEAGNSFSVTNLGTNVVAAGANNLIMTNTTRANVVVRASDGTHGFAARTGTAIGKLEGQTAVAAGTFNTVTSNTTNYIFGAGDYTTGAALNYQTMTFDSSGGVINLDFAAAGHTFNSTGNGRGVLFTGTNDVNFSGAGGGIGQSTWLHNYLDGSAQLNIGSSFGNTSYLIVGGTGFTNYTGTGLAAGANGEFVLNGGLFRYAPTASITLNAATHRINSAVFEIGANLAGGGALDLDRTTSNFRLTGDSGFSAHGAERKVSLGDTVTWGAANFLSNTANEDGDFTFRLSSAKSDATIDFTTKIDLNGKSRTVEVADGSAEVDARLSGGLTGSGIASRLVKTGAGTLEVTGVNDYKGTTRVEGGKMLVGGSGLTATTSVHVVNSTLGLMAGEVINDAADLTLENGIVTTAGNQTETLGRLTLIGNNQLDLVGLGNIIRMAESSTVTWSSSLLIYNWNGNSDGGGQDQFFVGADQDGLTPDQEAMIFFVNPEVDGVLYSGTFDSIQLATGEIVAVIPEPGSVALLAAGASLGLALRGRRA